VPIIIRVPQRSEASDKYPYETGGCLIGYFLDKNKEIVITNTIGPGHRSIHKNFYFKPDDEWQSNKIEKIYSKSGRLHTYLGDWHTHTLPSERLSREDKKTLSRISKYAPARAKTPIMGIMSFYGRWELVIWQLKKVSSVFYNKNVYQKLNLKLF
jgi:integrative and conjugative element protein (TIGR02256 family)